MKIRRLRIRKVFVNPFKDYFPILATTETYCGRTLKKYKKKDRNTDKTRIKLLKFLESHRANGPTLDMIQGFIRKLRKND